MGQVEPMGWTTFFITIIIKLSRKKYITLATKGVHESGWVS